MRVVIADDAALLRQGLARLLADAGIEVVGEAGDAGELLRLVEAEQPGRRDRRHPHAAHPHRRGSRRGRGDPASASRMRRARPVAVRRAAHMRFG